MVLKKSDIVKNYYKPGEVAELLGLHVRTIQKYDLEGKLKFIRSETGRRLISKEELLNYLDSNELIVDDLNHEKRDVVYARVSTTDQKVRGDLDRQALSIIEKVEDLKNPLVLKEVGSGLNDKRKKLLKLIELVENDEVNRVYITYKDRLTRFGYHYLEKIFNLHHVEIIVLFEENEIPKTLHGE